MINLRTNLAEIICNKICKQLTQNMDYKCLKLSLDKTRQNRAETQALDYSLNTIQHLKQLQQIQPQKNVKEQLMRSDTIQKTRQLKFGKRVSILKQSCKHSAKQIKTMQSSRVSKRTILKVLKQNHKGLVKLKSETDDQQSYNEYVQKQRQRKIKLAEVMQQFSEVRQKENQKQMKLLMRESSYSDRCFITTLTGQFIKCEKKQTKSKKDSLYLNKIRIKPIFRLRQQLNSKGQVQKQKEIRTETRRLSISNQVRGTENQIGKQENFFIKSIIDVITTRQHLDNGKRRKNVHR